MLYGRRPTIVILCRGTEKRAITYRHTRAADAISRAVTLGELHATLPFRVGNAWYVDATDFYQDRTPITTQPTPGAMNNARP